MRFMILMTPGVYQGEIRQVFEMSDFPADIQKVARR